MRNHNFYAGPSTLPVPVLEELRDQIADHNGMGLSLIETSHRSREYDEVHHSAMEGIRSHLSVPQGYDVLFLGGGATLQFGMIPLNYLPADGHCDFVASGSWAAKAISDAEKVGGVNLLFDGEETNFTTLPDPVALRPSLDSSYVHITSNETIQGLQWKNFPDTGEVPLVADMSSDILSRPIDISKFDLIYAGAQKNLGPAGVTLVIVSRKLQERSTVTLPAYLDYRTHAGKESLYNTPPVFPIYALSLVMKWITDQGGTAAIARRNEEKASVVYDAIEKSGDFYSCPVDPRYRSNMNIVFRLPTEDLEAEFINAAAERNMVGLKGHRSVGGIRASLYNALPLESALALATLMDEFAQRNGA